MPNRTYEAVNPNVKENGIITGSMLEIEKRKTALTNMLADIWNIPGNVRESLNLHQRNDLFRAEDGSSLKSGRMRLANSHYGTSASLNGVMEVAVAFDQADAEGRENTRLQILMPGENGQGPKPHYLTYDKENEKFIIGAEVEAPEKPKVPKKPGRWDRFVSHFKKVPSVEQYARDMAEYNRKKAEYDKFEAFCNSGSKLQGDIESAKQKEAEKKAKKAADAPEKAVENVKAAPSQPEAEVKKDNAPKAKAVNTNLEKYNEWVDATCEQFPNLKEIGQIAKAGMKHLSEKGNVGTFNELLTDTNRDLTLNAMGAVTLFNISLAGGLGGKEGHVFDSSKQATNFVAVELCRNADFRKTVMSNSNLPAMDPTLFNNFIATKGMNIAKSFPTICRSLGEKFANVEKNSEVKTVTSERTKEMVKKTKEYKMLQ